MNSHTIDAKTFQKLFLAGANRINSRKDYISFTLPKDGIVTDTMKSAAVGKTKLGVAYVVNEGVRYAVVLLG